jgi:hypothetical protein
LELSSQGCLACTRTTVEDEDSTRLQVALHTPKDARKSQDMVGLKPVFESTPTLRLSDLDP